MTRDFKKNPLRKRAAPFGGPTNEPSGNPSPPPGNASPVEDSPIDPAMDEEMGGGLEETEEDPMAPEEEEMLPENNMDAPAPRMPEPTPSVPPEININAETGESSIEFPGVNINITTEDSGLGTLQASKQAGTKVALEEAVEREIAGRFKNGESEKALAKEYGISIKVVKRIIENYPLSGKYSPLDTESMKHADVNDGRDTDYSNFMKGNKPDVEDPDPLSTDTHEFIMNNPKNRRFPSETFDVAVQVGGKYEDASSIQFALQESLNAQVDLEMPSESDPNQDYVVVRSVENPAALIEELAGYGLDAELVTGNLNDIYEGMKVAFIGDLPELGYYHDPVISMEARVTSIDNDNYYLYNNKFGHFIANLEEIDV